ncbi:hypothetical protein HYG86_09315 [Alkalicella caledoniensis]|uniref:Uncharacterized protein n=1 Tax=Alkalicella caledoniensis TaxID=2731377 RepID=A0A7G9W8E8_ALKCA|nr:hypothetical protein [Alkalicella caledoniensis]QNO14960.1 hypothetical protein HYG86_09315 [Alkalicella caledoniensis]
MKSYLRNFFGSPSNFIAFAVGLAPSVLLWVVAPEKTVSYGLFLIFMLIMFLIIWFLAFIIIKKSEEMNLLSQKLDVPSNPNLKIIQCINGICLCEKSELLSTDSIVSIFMKELVFENLVGYGVVINVQQDGYVQIKPTKLENTILDEDPLKNIDFIHILNLNKADIIIKPTISVEVIKDYQVKNKEVS